MRTRSVFALLVGLLATAASAAAPVGSAPEPLLYATGHDGPSALRVAIGRPAPTLSLVDVLSDPTVPARLFGVSEVHACAGGSVDPATLPAVLIDARRALLEMQTEAAYGMLARAAEHLPCATDIIPTAQLSDLFFLLGLSASYQEDEVLAIRWFRQAMAVSPGRQFDKDQSPRFYTQYLAAMEQHFSSRPVPLRLLRRVGEDVRIVLDGRELDTELGLDLEDGFHFLQFRRADGALATFQFRLGANDRPVLATGGGLADVAALGPAMDAGGAAATIEALRIALRGLSAASAQVVSGEWAWRFRADSGRFELLRAPLTRVERAHRFGLTSMVTGGVTLGAGLAMALTSYGAGKDLHPTQPGAVAPRAANVLGGLLTTVGGAIFVVSIPLTVGTSPVAPPPPRPPSRARPSSGATP